MDAESRVTVVAEAPAKTSELTGNPSCTYKFIKRAFDIVASAVGLVILSPLLLVLSVLIKLDSPGPALHRRMCVGRNGSSYCMYKFRSMRADADNRLDMFTPEQLAAYMQGVKIDNDPRITKIGHFLRRTSLDEIRTLFAAGKPVVFRVPVIGGYTDSAENCEAVIDLIKRYSPLKVELIKEHNLGQSKYISLGKTPLDLHSVTDAFMEEYKDEIVKSTGVLTEVCKI